jgi:hypothetical protein
MPWGDAGLFSSIPFWTLEKCDAGGRGKDKQHPKLLEHCRNFSTFVDALRLSLTSGVAELAETGAWVLVHCGSMRHRGKFCDIPFEVHAASQPRAPPSTCYVWCE